MFNDNIPFVGREDGTSRENTILPNGLVNSGVAKICVVGVGGAGGACPALGPFYHTDLAIESELFVRTGTRTAWPSGS